MLRTATNRAAALSPSNTILWSVAPLEAMVPPSYLRSALGLNSESRRRLVIAVRDYDSTHPRAPVSQEAIRRCGNCRKESHETRECAVPHPKEGETPIDPFCSKVSTDNHWLAHRGNNVPGGCPQLASLIAAKDADELFRVFVLERRCKPALRIKSVGFFFVGITIWYSREREQGKMPAAMEGLWPCTKNDAVLRRRQLSDVYEQGIHQMPAGGLEAMTFEEARDAYESGRLPPQTCDTLASKEAKRGRKLSSISPLPNVGPEMAKSIHNPANHGAGAGPQAEEDVDMGTEPAPLPGQESGRDPGGSTQKRASTGTRSRVCWYGRRTPGGTGQSRGPQSG